MVTEERRSWPIKHDCRGCGARPGAPGFILKRGGQNSLYCACGDYNRHNVSKQETGEPVAHVRSRPGLKPGQRTRILERDGVRCLLCGRSDLDLHIAHALSVHDIKKHDIVDIEENDDFNLFVSCSECNLDMSDRSVEARIFLHLIAARIRRGRQT